MQEEEALPLSLMRSIKIPVPVFSCELHSAVIVVPCSALRQLLAMDMMIW
jgi:hypothetical protein